MNTTMKKNYIAPKEETVVSFSSSICAASDLTFDGVSAEGITTGEELNFD